MFRMAKNGYIINEVIVLKFIDYEHKQFFEELSKKIKKDAKLDVYSKALIYILGICSIARKNYKEIFNIEEGEINVNSINKAWQTEMSKKVTRMAFNLWNGCVYDSEEDYQRGRKSNYYTPNEIFCCSYAPYFYEGIKLRYPEYTTLS